MNTIEYVASSFGRCATRYVRKDLDSVLPSYSVFLYRDQAYSLPRTLEIEAVGAIHGKFNMPPLGFGVYGMERNGTFTLLASCIDSSD
jgi:hypothetical protein